MLVVRLETRLVLEYYLSVSFVSLFLLFFDFFCCNHSIFRYDNFIGCFSADKIKMSVRK